MLYFGHPIPTTQRGKMPQASPALEKKGIRLLRAPPSDIHIFGLPIALSTFWGLFLSIFSTVLYCLSEKTIPSLAPTETEIKTKHPDPLPFFLPPLCVALESLSQQGIEYLLKLGFEQTEIRGQTYFLNSSVDRNIISELLKRECPVRLQERCFSPFRFVNLSAMFSVLDLITWFSFAAQAMGFTVLDDKSKDADNFDDSEAKAYDPADPMNENDEGGSSVSFVSDIGKHAIARLFGNGPPATLLDRFPSGTINAKSLLQRKCYFSASASHFKLSGNVLRYVQELADVDDRTVLDFIKRYMIRNIGENANDIAGVYSSLQSSWGLIKSTDFGLELSHLAKCMMLALDTGVQLYPIFDSNFYEGSVICGEGYSIISNEQVIRPLENDDLTEEIQTLATHTNTLLQIQKVAEREVNERSLGILECKSMVELAVFLMELPLTEHSKEAIVGLAANLRYPSRPWNVNVGSIERLIEISKSTANIKSSDPLGPRALFTKDAITVAMSCFGESSCPSFIHPNGTPINLTGSLPRPSGEQTSRQRGARGRQQTSNAAWTFAVRRVRFDEAIGDFRKLLREKTARSISSSVARGTGCVVFQGKQFSDIFNSLSQLATVLDGSAALTRMIEDTRMIGEVGTEEDANARLGHRNKRVKV